MKKNKIIKATAITLSVLAVLAIGGSIGMGGYVADRILHQNEDKDTSDNSIKQLEVWGYDLKAFEDKYEGSEVKATAEDGNTVPGTYFKNETESDKCVILVHGAGGDRVSIYPLAEGYLENGYDVIAIDQRGCGKNEDDKVTFGIHEKYDVEAMVKYARETLGEDKVIVHGQSMGAQTTALYASSVKDGAGKADAVICDSPVPGMELILKEMFGDGDTESFVANYLTGTSKVFMNVVDGIDFDDGDTIEMVKNDTLPTMIIVSEKDEVCLPDQVEEIYGNIASGEKQIMRVDSAHIEGIIDDSEGYMNGVMDFLDSVGI